MAEAGPAVTDPYRVLGVPRSATPDEIKRAYRKLAKQHHPDLNPADPGATRRFQELAQAYEILSDPRSRASWDRSGRVDDRRDVARDEAIRAFLKEFQRQLQLMTGLFLREILPRYIDRSFRGRGVLLVHELLEDIERHRVLERVSGPPPSARARGLADAVAQGCPVSWRTETVVDDRGKVVLGRMLQGFAPRGRVLVPVARIELFAGSFHTAGHHHPDRLAAAILPVVATEYVRLLESNLPAGLRPLAARDSGGRAPRLDLVQAARADARWVMGRAATVAGFAALVLAAIWIVLFV